MSGRRTAAAVATASPCVPSQINENFRNMKQEVTTTLKVRLKTSDSEREMLAAAAAAYRDACNFVSGYVFDTGDEKVYSLNKVLYQSANLSVSALRSAAISQTTIESVR